MVRAIDEQPNSAENDIIDYTAHHGQSKDYAERLLRKMIRLVEVIEKPNPWAIIVTYREVEGRLSGPPCSPSTPTIVRCKQPETPLPRRRPSRRRCRQSQSFPSRPPPTTSIASSSSSPPTRRLTPSTTVISDFQDIIYTVTWYIPTRLRVATPTARGNGANS